MMSLPTRLDRHASTGMRPDRGPDETQRIEPQYPAKETMSPENSFAKPPTKLPVIGPQDVVRKLRFDYTYASKTASDRMVDALTELLDHFRNERVNVMGFLQDTSKLIHKQLRIQEVSIGIRSPLDGLYKYAVMSGMREFVWAEHKTLTYTKEDFGDFTKWGGFTVSEMTRVFLYEEKPYLESEKGTFDSQMSQKMKRKAPDAYVEGDYMDVYVRDKKKEVIAWIETGGTWDGKLPDAQAIKWLEFVGSLLAIPLTEWDGR